MNVMNIYICVYIYMHMSVYLGTRPPLQPARSGGCSDRWAPDNRKEEGIHIYLWMLWIYIYTCVYIHAYICIFGNSPFLAACSEWRLLGSLSTWEQKISRHQTIVGLKPPKRRQTQTPTHSPDLFTWDSSPTKISLGVVTWYNVQP